MAQRITLKKYPNRRLYDTDKSVYVTLNDVADMVRQGIKVEVIDLKTNQDVTAFTLTQIIMEQTKKNNTILPVSLLHLIIRFGENSLNEFFEKNLEQIIRSYLNHKKNMEEQFQICLELGIDLSAMAEKTINQMTPFQSFLGHSASEDDKKE